MKKPFGLFLKADALFAFLLILLLSLTALSAILESLALVLVGLLVVALLLFRILSGNTAARARENELFCRVAFTPVRITRRLWRKLFADKTHVFTRCPVCTAKLRLKKTPGHFTVTCPACATRFPVHID